MTSTNVSADDKFRMLSLCVELADRTSARRAGANTFFVSLHSIAASVVGYLAIVRNPNKQMDHFSLALLAFVGVVLSLTWWAILAYYRRLNKAKWAVINNLEQGMALQPFTDEWKLLHPATPGTGLRGWLRRSKHREATRVEQIVPLTFAVVYILIAARVIAS